MARLMRALADLCLMAVPVFAGIAAVIVTLLFWPGGIIGGLILFGIGLAAQRHTRAIQREHHW